MRPILNVAVFKIGSFFFFEMALEMQKNVKKNKQTILVYLDTHYTNTLLGGIITTTVSVVCLRERESPEKK